MYYDNNIDRLCFENVGNITENEIDILFEISLPRKKGARFLW